MTAYILTIIGALFKTIFDWLSGAMGGGDNVEFLGTFFLIIGLIFTLLGIKTSFRNLETGREKLISLGIHAGIWLLAFIGVGIVLPIIILFVLAAVLDHFLLGGAIRIFILNKLAGLQETDSGVTMNWPPMVFDAAMETFILQNNFGDSAIYKSESGKEAHISISDVNGNTMSSIFGELHW